MNRIEVVVAFWLAVLGLCIAYIAAAPWLAPALKDSSAAGWVQAIGALMAIGVTVWISRRDHALDQRQTVAAVYTCAHRLVRVLDDLEYAARDVKTFPFNKQANVLRELLVVARNIELQRLPESLSWLHLDVVSLAASMVGVVNTITTSGRPHSLFEELRHAAAEARTLARAIGESTGMDRVTGGRKDSTA